MSPGQFSEISCAEASWPSGTVDDAPNHSHPPKTLHNARPGVSGGVLGRVWGRSGVALRLWACPVVVRRCSRALIPKMQNHHKASSTVLDPFVVCRLDDWRHEPRHDHHDLPTCRTTIARMATQRSFCRSSMVLVGGERFACSMEADLGTKHVSVHVQFHRCTMAQIEVSVTNCGQFTTRRAPWGPFSKVWVIP